MPGPTLPVVPPQPQGQGNPPRLIVPGAVAGRTVTTASPLPGVGSSAPVRGTLPAGQVAFLLYAGSITGTTDGGGGLDILFPQPFLNGVLVALAVPGDITNNLGQVAVQGGLGTLAKMHIRAMTPAGVAIATLAVTVNWLAFGW